jgi:hypothetical protein
MRTSFRSKLISFLLISACALSAVSQQTRQASAINEATLKAHIKFLADDLLEGRGTGARGGELAAKYIASQLEAVGVKGAAPGDSFFQPVSLVGVKADPGTALTISGSSGKETLNSQTTSLPLQARKQKKWTWMPT